MFVAENFLFRAALFVDGMIGMTRLHAGVWTGVSVVLFHLLDRNCEPVHKIWHGLNIPDLYNCF